MATSCIASSSQMTLIADDAVQAAPGSSKSSSSTSRKDAKAQRKIPSGEFPGMCHVVGEVTCTALIKMFRDAELLRAHNYNSKGHRGDKTFGRTRRLRCRKAKAKA